MAMNNVVTRVATMDDYDAICRLLAQVDRYHFDILPDVFQTFIGPPRAREIVAAHVEGADADYIVAECDGEILGFVNLREQGYPKFPGYRPSRFAMIENMVVDEKHRRGGIGTKLLLAAKDWARDRGLASIQLSVWIANEPAVSLYGKLGFQPIVERMEYRLQ